MGLAAASHFIVNVGITEAGPSAFATIKENYYYVFVGCQVVFLIAVCLWFPETKGKTLEEIAASFGDKVVLVEESDILNAALQLQGGQGLDLKGEVGDVTGHVENVNSTKV